MGLFGVETDFNLLDNSEFTTLFGAFTGDGARKIALANIARRFFLSQSTNPRIAAGVLAILACLPGGFVYFSGMTKLLISRNGLFALLGFLLAGCASTVRYVNYSEHLAAYDVDGHVVEKMRIRRPLELIDIRHLAEKGVPDSLLIGYLKQERTVYQLNSEQVQMLAEAGVSKEVIDYLLTTPAARPVRAYPVYYWHGPPPFLYPGGFWFPYGYYCY